MKNHTSFFYESFIILQCLLWGIGNVGIKISLETITPLYSLALRFTLAFLLFIIFFGKKIKQELSLNSFKNALIPCFLSAFAFVFANLSFKFTTATTATFLLGLPILFSPLLTFFILRKKSSLKTYLAIIIAIIGLFYLCGNSGKFKFGYGESFALLSAFIFSAMLTYSSKYLQELSPQLLSTLQIGITTLISFLLAFIFEDYQILSHASLKGWLIILYLAIGSTFIAYLLQNYSLKYVSPVFVSLAFCAEPVFTATTAYFFLGEKLSLSGIYGALLILSGLVIASLKQAPKSKSKIREQQSN